MTKRLASKYHVCKNLRNSYKNLWGIVRKNNLHSILNRKKKKLSLFGKLLNVKQSLKFFYTNIKEQKFKKLIKSSIVSPSKSMDKLSSSIESRLDCILFRSCIVRSFHEARQVINHKYVSVNGMLVTNPGFTLRKKDVVRLNIVNYNFTLFNETLSSRSIPSYLEVDLVNLSIIFLWDSNFKTYYYPMRLKYLNVFRYYK